jgi:hypothetical protein
MSMMEMMSMMHPSMGIGMGSVMMGAQPGMMMDHGMGQYDATWYGYGRKSLWYGYDGRTWYDGSWYDG